MNQTTSSRKSWNIQALRGSDVDDMEVINEYNLDPALAYTPEINAAALEAQRQRNLDYYHSKGMDMKEADKRANDQFKSVAKDVDKIVRQALRGK